VYIDLAVLLRGSAPTLGLIEPHLRGIFGRAEADCSGCSGHCAGRVRSTITVCIARVYAECAEGD